MWSRSSGQFRYRLYTKNVQDAFENEKSKTEKFLVLDSRDLEDFPRSGEVRYNQVVVDRDSNRCHFQVLTSFKEYSEPPCMLIIYIYIFLKLVRTWE